MSESARGRVLAVGWHRGLLAVVAVSCLLAWTATPAVAAAPKVISTSVSKVTTDSALLEATINPEGKAVGYRFEYGPSDCSVNPCTTMPSLEGTLSKGSSPVPVSAPLEGLMPGSAYHFRVVAENGSETTDGPDTLFTTYRLPIKFEACPNDALRVGELSPTDHPSASLPDCRAYEQASPVEKRGEDARGTVEMVKAADGGGAVSFLTTNGVPGGEGGQNLPTYLASRGAANWSTQGLLPNQSAGSGARVLGWTSDFSRVLDSAWTVGESPTLGDFLSTAFLARSSADGSLETIAPYVPKLAPNFAGASTDGSKALFESNIAIPGVAGAIEGKPNLYLWDRSANTLRLAGILNDGSAPPRGALAGAYDWAAGTNSGTLGGGGADPEAGYYTQDNHVISDAGSGVYFTAAGSGTLYLRNNPAQEQSKLDETGKCSEPAKACTIAVSASQRTSADPAGRQPAAFTAATPDGARAFFTSSEKLTDDASTGPEQAAPSIARADVTAGSGLKADFLPVTASGIAIAGEHIYWADASKGWIGRAKLNGSGDATDVEEEFITGVGKPRWLAVDSEYVYWTDPGEKEGNEEGSIGRAKLDLSESPELNWITGLTSPQGIAVNAANIYWANISEEKLDGRRGAIGRADLEGNGAETNWFDLGPGRKPQGIALNATSLYWATEVGAASLTNSLIERVDLDGSSNYKLLGLVEDSKPVQAAGIALDGGHVYWASDNFQAIGRANLSLEEAQYEFIPTEGNLKDVEIDPEHIYWTVNGEPQPNPGNDLYRYDAGTGELSDLSVDNADPDGAEVRGILGASADGSRVYFAANGDLDGPEGPATTGNCQGTVDDEAGSCNLYLSQPDPAQPSQSEVVFIARLAGGDRDDWRPNSSAAGTHIYTPRNARVSPDGRTLLFASTRQLTPYDNKGVMEFYRYRAGGGALACVSCNPSGVAPQGSPDQGRKLKLSFLSPPGPASLLSRNLSDSGDQVFFETTDALLPEDTNGAKGCPEVGPAGGLYPSCLDVYEWEAMGAGSCESKAENGGCLYLLSPPEGNDASFFGDASASGDDVFLFTRTGLVGQDQDQLLDVYDARVDGGLAAQNEPPKPKCEGEGCKPGTGTPPAFESPQTNRFEGPGNAKAKSGSRCPKGKKAVRSKGKTRCVAKKKQHKGKKNKRGARKSGRAGR